MTDEQFAEERRRKRQRDAALPATRLRRRTPRFDDDEFVLLDDVEFVSDDESSDAGDDDERDDGDSDDESGSSDDAGRLSDE